MMKTIKYVKYPNRRLYDTDLSKYVPFSSLRERIMNGYDILVLSHGKEEDVTREVLVSLLLDQSMPGNDLFTEDLMRMIIKFYGNPMRDYLKVALDQNHALFNAMLNGGAALKKDE